MGKGGVRGFGSKSRDISWPIVGIAVGYLIYSYYKRRKWRATRWKMKLNKMKLNKMKQKGGGGSSTGEIYEPLTLLLLTMLAFIIYLLMYPSTITEKIIYKNIVKEEDQPYRDNIYTPDIKQTTRNPQFNIKTRGPPQEYNMVGFLQDQDDTNKLQQLYGRQTYHNSNQWNYFVKSDQYHQIPIPVSIGNDSCTDERGCKELQDQDTLQLFNKQHKATIYKPEPYYYNPYVI
jgi:hypothetical protein